MPQGKREESPDTVLRHVGYFAVVFIGGRKAADGTLEGQRAW